MDTDGGGWCDWPFWWSQRGVGWVGGLVDGSGGGGGGEWPLFTPLLGVSWDQTVCLA